MTTLALPVTPPPATGGHGGGRGRPAPVQTMLAVIARIASHVALDPASVTMTQPTKTVDVNLADRESYLAWRGQVEQVDNAVVHADELGTVHESTTVLHGWVVRLRIAGPS